MFAKRSATNIEIEENFKISKSTCQCFEILQKKKSKL